MFRKFLRDWFTFSKTERNGLIVLVVIISVLIGARTIIPHFRKNTAYDFSEFQDEINQFEKSLNETGKSGASGHEVETEINLSFFDPNTASREELKNTGLDLRVVSNILKYREKGGKFRTREDLKKIYGLDPEDYSRIEQYIIISPYQPDTSGWKEARSIDTMNNNARLKRQIRVSLSTADSAELAGISGIGPILSSRIIKYRDILGGYVSKDQLLEVYGMTQENFERIKDHIIVDSNSIALINLNKASADELSRHPYLTEYQARSLVAYREISGRFVSTDEIITNNLLPYDIYKKIRPYLVAE